MSFVEKVVGKQGVCEKKVGLKILTVKEFFKLQSLAKKLDSDNLDENEFNSVMNEFKKHIQGLSDDEPMVILLDAVKKLIEVNTLPYEEYKKK